MSPLDFIHEDPCCAVCTNPRLGAQNLPKKRAACRYFQSGSCRRGSNCPFTHLPLKPPPLSHLPYPAEHMYAYHPLAPSPVYRPLDSQPYPVFLWKPYSPSFDLQYRFVHQPVDDLDDKTDPSSAESSTVASMEYPSCEQHGLEAAADAASSPDDPGVNSSPGYVGYPVFSGLELAERDPAPSIIPPPPSSALSWQGEPRKKPLAYKTKPCKFYAASGKCTSGEKCTFIHSVEADTRAGNSPVKLAPSADVQLPAKPLNKYDECHARDFYPITWRVIGGGVMMGGQRQSCPAFLAGHCKYGDDCKFAHETEVETDPVGFIEPKGESEDGPIKNAKRGRSNSQRPKSIKVHALEPVPFPSRTPPPEKPDQDINAEQKKNDDLTVPPSRDPPISPVHRRTRSFSMVLTSSSPLDTTNYAAEL